MALPIYRIVISQPAKVGEGYQVSLRLPDRTYPGTLKVDLARLRALATFPARYGEELGKAFFTGEIGKGFERAMSQPARFQLEIGPAELHAIAWERLCYPSGGKWLPLGTSGRAALSRRVEVEDAGAPPPISGERMKVLLVIASPADLKAAAGLDEIPAAARARLKGLLTSLGKVDVVCLETGAKEPPTLANIKEKLDSGFDVVHFLCHGVTRPAGSFLYLEAEGGGVDAVPAGRLVAELADKRGPVMYFFAACETAVQHDTALVSLGVEVVKGCGPRVVVAMAERVSTATALDFTKHFYRRLLAHGDADLAGNEARSNVKSRPDWSAPVVYTRVDDAQVVGVAAKVEERPVGRVALAAAALLALGVGAWRFWPDPGPGPKPVPVVDHDKNKRFASIRFHRVDATGKLRIVVDSPNPNLPDPEGEMADGKEEVVISTLHETVNGAGVDVLVDRGGPTVNLKCRFPSKEPTGGHAAWIVDVPRGYDKLTVTSGTATITSWDQPLSPTICWTEGWTNVKLTVTGDGKSPMRLPARFPIEAVVKAHPRAPYDQAITCPLDLVEPRQDLILRPTSFPDVAEQSIWLVRANGPAQIRGPGGARRPKGATAWLCLPEACAKGSRLEARLGDRVEKSVSLDTSCDELRTSTKCTCCFQASRPRSPWNGPLEQCKRAKSRPPSADDPEVRKAFGTCTTQTFCE